MNPLESSMLGLRQAIHDRKTSAREVTQAYLDRIAAHNASLNAYHEVFADEALAKADDVDAGRVTGPLAGVPIAIKDNLCTTFGHTTCSSKMLEQFRAPYTATAVEKLEAAGAVILGKTNMDEFAMGSSSEHVPWGPVRNPWDTDRVPGGSSGGSASAMAADLCAAAIGSDTGGSIRQPAAYCGVVGFKPTYGRISRYGLVAFASSLDQIGPITRDVADAAALFDVMQGRDPRDTTSADVPPAPIAEAIHQGAKGLRVGLAKQYITDANEPAVAAAVDNAVAIYKAAGAEIVEVDLPHTSYGIPTYYIVATAEASSNLARYDGVHYGHRTANPKDLVDLYSQSRAEGFGDEVKLRIMLGAYALSSGYYDAYYLRALKVRRLIRNDFDAAFANCDVILCPTTTGPAFRLGEKTDDPLTMYLNDAYTVNANLAGIPGISLPGGFADGADAAKRLPVGVQLFSKAFDEATLFRAAHAYEHAAGFTHQRPTMAS